MAGAIRISAPALRWLTREAERVAEDFGERAARDFQTRVDEALQHALAFPSSAVRGLIPGTRTFVINRRTILTLVMRDGDLIVAAARSHRQDADDREL